MIIKFRDIAEFVAGQSPESKYYSLNEGTPFLQGNRTFGRFYPTIDTYTTKVTKMAKKGDILMSVRAPVGDLNFADRDICIGRGLSSIRAKDGNNEFLFYALKYNVKNFIRQSNGTTYDSITRDVVEDMDIIIPNDKNSYKKIRDILYSIDSKIENNNKINAELESMAKTLYDYWFLQFEFPNKEGKPYKSSGGKMVYNEELKKEIPEGWEAKHLKECCDVVLGGTPKTEVNDFWNGNINWLNSGEIANFPVVDSELKITEKGMNNSATTFMKRGSVVVSITGNLRASILAIDSCANQSVVGILENSDFKSSYIYPFLKDMIYVFERVSTGNCQQHINKGTIQDSLLLVPDKRILKAYYKNIENNYSLIFKNALENQELSSLRDFLLPLLMNGQATIQNK